MRDRLAILLSVVALSIVVDATNAYAFVSLPPPVHTTLVFFHVFGAILFMGNIVVSAMWMGQAKRNHNPHVLHFAAKSVMRADKMFTIPGLLLVLITGLLTVGPWGGFGKVPWAELALTLFIISGVIWGVVLLRLQKRMILLATAAVDSGEVGTDFHQALKKWNMWGGIATMLPFVALILMVSKPSLWG